MNCSVLATQSPDGGSILYSRDELCKPPCFEARKASSSGKCLASLYLKFSDLHNSIDMHTGLLDLKLNTAMKGPHLFTSPTA